MSSVTPPAAMPVASPHPMEDSTPSSLAGITVVVFGILMQMLVIGTYLFSFTLWVEPWSTEFDASTTKVMVVPSIYLYANALALLFLGRYLDTFPHRWSVGIGLCSFSLSMFLISISPSLEVIYLIYLVIVPLSVAFCGPVPAITLVSQVFRRRRGLAVGFVALGTSLGGMAVPHFVVFMMSEVGWRATNRVFAIIALVLAALAFVVLRHNPGESAVRNRDSHVRKGSNWTYLIQKEFWFCIIASSGAYFVFMAIQFNMAPIASEMGFAPGEIAFTITLFTGGMLGGKIFSGVLSEFLDPRFTYLFIGALMAGALGVLAFEPAETVILFAVFALGLGAGSVLPLKGLIFAQIFGTRQLGRVMGLAAPFVAVYSFGPVTASYLRSVFGDYNAVFLVLIAILIVTVPFVLLLRKLPSHERSAGG